MITLTNVSQCAIIIPGVGEMSDLTGLIAPMDSITVDDSVANTDFIRNLVTVGELRTSAALAGTSELVQEVVTTVAQESIDDLRKKCDDAGVQYSLKWSESRLQQALDAAK